MYQQSRDVFHQRDEKSRIDIERSISTTRIANFHQKRPI